MNRNSLDSKRSLRYFVATRRETAIEDSHRNLSIGWLIPCANLRHGQRLGVVASFGLAPVGPTASGGIVSSLAVSLRAVGGMSLYGNFRSLQVAKRSCLPKTSFFCVTESSFFLKPKKGIFFPVTESDFEKSTKTQFKFQPQNKHTFRHSSGLVRKSNMFEFSLALGWVLLQEPEQGLRTGAEARGWCQWLGPDAGARG